MIDVHAHYLSDAYRAALLTAGHERPDGMPAIPSWSANEHIAMMDRLGIRAAMLSVSSPGVTFLASSDQHAAPDPIALARHVNDVAAEAIAEHPGRFGAWASLPLSDISASLAEIDRSLDELGLDGVVMLTNIAGTYMGDSSFDPVLAELHRRKATVFIHPTSPACHECVSMGYPRPMIEFPFDTTRAVTNLAFLGAFDRYDGIRWIIPHAGGTLPFLSARIAGMSALTGRQPSTIFDPLRSVYYDLAGSTSAQTLAALDLVAEPAHVLYGSDWPFTPEAAVAGLKSALDDRRVTTLTANARALLERFA